MPEKPTLMLARRIVNNYLNGRFTLVIIEGALRIGKTTYAYKSIDQAYKYLYGQQDGVELLKRFMGWEPTEVIDHWIDLVGERFPCYIWDDGGCWLFVLEWSDPVMREFQRYFNLIGTQFGTILITTPSVKWVLNKIGKLPKSLWVEIHYRYPVPKGHVGTFPEYIKWKRYAAGYNPYYLPDKQKGRVKRWKRDYFSCKMPDDVFKWYEPRREHYAEMIRQRMKQKILEKWNAKDKLQEVKDKLGLTNL